MALRNLLFLGFAVCILILSPTGLLAQSTDDPRASTGGAQTLEDIMTRQRGEALDDQFRRDDLGNPGNGALTSDQLGTLGGVSDPELWRALRFGEADVTVSSRSPAAEVIMQDSGMSWLKFREGPLLRYGGYLLLGMVGLLALFYLIRGKIRIDGPKTGQKILRFTAIERFAHWLMGGSFILLAVTGLIMLFGRIALIPLFGSGVYAPLAMAGKWVHNNVAWGFMIGLAMVTVFWIAHNLPNRHDLVWLAKGGGLFSKGVHPPAKKFNAGQKIIFWSVLVLGVSISLSGLSLLFPFEMPMFAKTFSMLNATGLPQLLGFGELQTVMTPHQEMQLAQTWHAIVAFVFIAIILAHIYIGSVGMEGAFDAVGTGEVDVAWAKEHHSLWYEEATSAEVTKAAETPAE